MLHKHDLPLIDLEDWRVRAKPKSPRHWQDFRSAKETAKRWLGAFPDLPSDLCATLSSHPDFSGVIEWSAEPEVQLRFDKRRGEPRNTDLLVRARDSSGEFVVAVEAKADEPFDQPIAKVLEDAHKRLVANPRSGGVARVEELIASLIPADTSSAESDAKLRYQLFTAAAGVLAFAEQNGISRAVLYVQEFVTPKTHDENHRVNSDDLDDWLDRVSAGTHSSISDRQLVGPIRVSGAPLLTGSADLYVGKAQIRVR
jgi:hypothetical protein